MLFSILYLRIVGKKTRRGYSNCGIGGARGSVTERRTPEREVGGSKPTLPCCVLQQYTPLLPESTGITQEAMAPSRHD